MVNELYVILRDATGKAIAVKGPFEQDQTREIYSAIEAFEDDYALNSSLTLCDGGRIVVSRVVFVKEPML